MKISVGPLPYYWNAQELRTFFASLSASDIDCIYLGETVCSKRRAIRTAEWIELARELSKEFAEVVISTLTLIEAESELATLKRLCDNGEFRIEANDLAAVTLLHERKLPFVAGPFLNLYHARSLAMVANAGAYRWVPPVEMSAAALTTLQEEYQALAAPDLETELFAYGRAPLAHSARCFSARVHDRNKDDCGFVCREHPFGLPLATRENDAFLNINGIQVQSAAVHAVTDFKSMRAAGVARLRLVPADENFPAVVAAYAGGGSAVTLPHPVVDGYWRGTAGMSG